jgi:hypothetical protein
VGEEDDERRLEIVWKKLSETKRVKEEERRNWEDDKRKNAQQRKQTGQF